MRSLERNFSDRGKSKDEALVMGMGLVCLRLKNGQCNYIMSKEKNGMMYLKKRLGPTVVHGVSVKHLEGVHCPFYRIVTDTRLYFQFLLLHDILSLWASVSLCLPCSSFEPLSDSFKSPAWPFSFLIG